MKLAINMDYFVIQPWSRWSVSVVGTKNLCRAIIYRNQTNNENLRKTHLNIPAYSSDTWWETAVGVRTAVWSTHPEVSVTGQLVSVLFFSALEQMLSWWLKSASHCTFLVQPSTRLCSKFTPSRNPSDVIKIAPNCWPMKCKIQRKTSASSFCCILPTVNVPLFCLLYFPTLHLDPRLFLPEGRAGISWVYSEQ